MLWTEPQKQAVRASYGKISASLLAETIGKTRNAVLGWAHRNGLSEYGGRSFVPTDNNRPFAARPRREPMFRPRKKVNATMPPIILDNDIPPEQRKTLMELREDDCRWPVGEVGDPGFFFCGGPVETGQSYCAGHCARAYQVGNERRPFIPSRNAA